eukprot:TRINITY_DN2367_c0_g1_i1.p1 TRINITY_DN2367_c0_g1~~TRINITY_DN2367_c0_g1_i1.p1  ORF type:complete len:664 (-),score=128.92 TRINITY_DN2367_c0_g1_i1:738-2729(-)
MFHPLFGFIFDWIIRESISVYRILVQWILLIFLSNVQIRWTYSPQERQYTRSRDIIANQDAITTLTSPPSSDYIVTTGFSGDIIVRDADWSIKSIVPDLYPEILFAYWSNDGKYFLATVEPTGEEQQTILLLFKFNEELGELEFDMRIVGENRLFDGHFSMDGDYIFCIEQSWNSVIEKKRKDNNLDDEKVLFVVYNLKGDRIKEVVLPELIDKDNPDLSYPGYVQAIQTNRNGLIAVSRRGSILIMNENLDIVHEILFHNYRVVKTMIFDQDDLICDTTSGKLSIYRNGELERDIHSVSGGYFMDWAIRGETMWVIDDASINQINLTDEPVDIVKHIYHDMVCCGIDINQDGSQVACGDFSGQVLIWNTDEPGKPIKKGSAGWMPIRALIWKKGTDYINIGCMDGNVYAWNINENGDELPVVFTMDDAITSMKWEKGDNPYRIAAGTTSGTLAIYEHNEDGSFKEVFNLKAHKPSSGEQDLNFGSMNIFSEIWSISWSPNNQYIATASEDQTTRIWDLDGNELHQLIGHTTAVTSIEWISIAWSDIGINQPGHGEAILTCADDQTVMMWINTEDQWELHHVFDTKAITEWHTLTYLTILDNSVVVVTQNGWIYAWDLRSKERIASGKMHMGSVEGLVSNISSNCFASCSSDCSIMVTKFKVN